MPYRDLPHFLDALDREGLLRRVRAEVSQDLEISGIADRVVKAGGPALLFENVRGHSIPVAINLFGTPERMALALDVPSLDALAERLSPVLSLATHPPAGGLIEKIKAIPRLIDLAGILPQTVSEGACKEVVLRDARVDLDRFPILKCWPGDGGRFLTFPLVFTRDPETGVRNVGIYRMQVFDGRTTGMHIHWHKDGARHLRKARAPLPAAVAVGCDPALCFAAALPLPPDVDEALFAGLLRGEPTSLVKCETIDLEAPANAEIVLEGTIDPSERRREGPFGDHTGYYSPEDDFPVFRIRAITHRARPVYHAALVGPPPQEDAVLGAAIERLLLPLLRLHLPEVVDYHMPPEGVFHNLMLVSIRKQYPGHARKVMHAIWGLPQAMFTKCLVVFDEDVNVRDPREACWKALNHIDPERDFEFAMGPVDLLDHASRLPGYGSHVGIDATRKLPGEGFGRPWPEEIRMSPGVRERVDRLCRELGL